MGEGLLTPSPLLRPLRSWPPWLPLLRGRRRVLRPLEGPSSCAAWLRPSPRWWKTSWVYDGGSDRT
eukprot:1243702-Alexandrium_andersonii.AAC.1